MLGHVTCLPQQGAPKEAWCPHPTFPQGFFHAPKENITSYWYWLYMGTLCESYCLDSTCTETPYGIGSLPLHWCRFWEFLIWLQCKYDSDRSVEQFVFWIHVKTVYLMQLSLISPRNTPHPLFCYIRMSFQYIWNPCLTFEHPSGYNSTGTFPGTVLTDIFVSWPVAKQKIHQTMKNGSWTFLWLLLLFIQKPPNK